VLTDAGGFLNVVKTLVRLRWHNVLMFCCCY
jgi:hypothetical protein